MKNSPIGIFDSGLGGLSVFRELLKTLPEYDYLYLGDNARVPYGDRSANVIYQFTKNAVDFLFKNNCQVVVLACNTASANALRRLQHEYLPKHYPDRRILGVIRPVVEIVGEKKLKRVGVMATQATVSSSSYPAEITKIDPSIEVFQQACPLFVPAIEENEMGWEGFNLLVKKYAKPLLKNNIDSLILGCTHYALVVKDIKRLLPIGIQVISQSGATAIKLADYLKRHPEIDKKLSKNSKRAYYATAFSSRYGKLTELFLGDYFEHDTKLQIVKLPEVD